MFLFRARISEPQKHVSVYQLRGLPARPTTVARLDVSSFYTRKKLSRPMAHHGRSWGHSHSNLGGVYATQFPWGFAQCTSPSGLLSAIVFYVTALQLYCTDVIILHGAHVQAVLFFKQHQTHLIVESSPDALCFKPWAVSTCITVESRVAVWRLQVIRRKRGFLHCDSLMTRFPLSHNNIHKDDTIVQTQLSDAVWYAVSLAIRYLCYL